MAATHSIEPRLGAPAGARGAWIAGILLAIAIAGWLLNVTFTWPTFFGMGPATGGVAALADGVCRGQAPGHDDGTTLLASVYFPPFPCAVAALHAAGLGWLDALRLASVLTALALLAAAAAVARSLGGGRRAVAIAWALILASWPFVASSLAGRADLMTAALSVGALAAWCRDPSLKGWASPALAAAAWFTKLTALTLPLAVLIWCVQHRDFRALVRFHLRFLIAAALLLVASLPVHGPGWVLDAIRTVSVLAHNTTNLMRGPAEFLRYLGSFPELAVATALALALLLRPAWRSRPPFYFLIAGLLIAMTVMANYGATENHLIELFAVAAVASGVWAERTLARPAAVPAWLLAIAVVSGSVRETGRVVRHAAEPIQRRSAILARVRAEAGDVFTEDALISLGAGRRAAISDPLVFRALEVAGDPRARRVAAGLENGRYALVVLDGDPFAPEQSRWYHDFNLGGRATDAIRSGYVRGEIQDGYTAWSRR
jgi:Glycosyltransferase family 87